MILIENPQKTKMLSNDKTGFSLWSSTVYQQYFLLPHSQGFSSGDFVLRAITGEERKVDRSEITPFEVTEAAARNHLQAEAIRSLNQTKIAIAHLLEFSAKTQSKISSSSPNQSELDLLFAILGTATEASEEKPDTAQKNLFSRFKEAIENSLSNDPVRLNTARDQMHSLGETLQSQGIDLEKELEEFSDQLRKFNTAPASHHPLQETTDKLRALADQIDRSFETGEPGIDLALFDLVGNLNEFLTDKDPAQQQKQQQEYRDLAKAAIDRSFRNHPTPTFNFEELLAEPKTEDD